MKKLSSLLLALAMMATSITAFAAIPEDAAPKGNVKIVETEEEGYYIATVDLSDVGTLSHTKNGTKYSGTKIVSYTLEVKGSGIALDDYSESALGESGFSLSQDVTSDSPAGFDGIQMVYNATTAKAAYPTETPTSNDIEGACIFAFYGVPGSTVTIGASQIGYTTFVDNKAVGVAGERLNVAYDVTEFTLPGGEPEPAADVVVNSGDKYNNGYVWNVTVNKDMEAFGVKFYSGEDTLAKSVKNVDALPKLDGGVGYNFNVGLKTAKTIDQADFTADDATASWKAE